MLYLNNNKIANLTSINIIKDKLYTNDNKNIDDYINFINNINEEI